jgi:hypothetical protein
MPKRSSRDENERAFDAILEATDDATGPEVLAELIGSFREGIDEGASDEDLALRLWPRLERVVLAIMAVDDGQPVSPCTVMRGFGHSSLWRSRTARIWRSLAFQWRA